MKVECIPGVAVLDPVTKTRYRCTKHSWVNESDHSTNPHKSNQMASCIRAIEAGYDMTDEVTSIWFYNQETP